MLTDRQPDLSERLAHLGEHLDAERAALTAHEPDRHANIGDRFRRPLTIAAAVIIVGGVAAIAQLDRRADSPTPAYPAGQESLTTPMIETVDSLPSSPESTVPTTSAEPVASSTPAVDTILSPPVVVDDPKILTQAEADAISKDAGGRRTVAIERGADGTVLWWMTVWAATTPSGVEVFCTASRAAGHSCVPDHNVVLSHPAQVSGFSQQAPSALTLLANFDVISLRASIDDAEPVEVQLVDIGVSSGKQAAGLYLGDIPATTVRFDATLRDGSSYSFAIPAPDVAPGPNSTPAVPSPPEPYAPLELFTD